MKSSHQEAEFNPLLPASVIVDVFLGSQVRNTLEKSQLDRGEKVHFQHRSSAVRMKFVLSKWKNLGHLPLFKKLKA